MRVSRLSAVLAHDHDEVAVTPVVELRVGDASVGGRKDGVARLAIEVHARVPSGPLGSLGAEFAGHGSSPRHGIAVVGEFGFGHILRPGRRRR